jgi:hypothetical protein
MRTVRLGFLLGAVLAALLIVRAVVVAVINSDRLSGDRLGNLQIHGRYYPVEKVCPVLDRGALEQALKGDAPLRREGLLATGNRLDVRDDQATTSCGWRNFDFGRSPRVSFTFTAVIRGGRITDVPACTPDASGGTAETVALGRYRACVRGDAFQEKVRVIDDNATVQCTTETVDQALKPALAQAMRPQCERLLDRLARSRPISFWGNGFWTVS